MGSARLSRAGHYDEEITTRAWHWLLAGMLGCTAAWADDDVAKGGALVKAKCVACHAHDRLLKLASRAPEADRAARLDKFLPSHNAPSPDDRKAIIAYLLDATRQ